MQICVEGKMQLQTPQHSTPYATALRLSRQCGKRPCKRTHENVARRALCNTLIVPKMCVIRMGQKVVGPA